MLKNFLDMWLLPQPSVVTQKRNDSGLRCNLCFGIIEVEICDLCDLDVNRRYRPSLPAKHSLLCCCSDNVLTPSTNLTFLFYFYAVTVNVLPLESTVWSHVHVKTASTSLFMKILSLQLANRSNQETLLLLLLK